MVLTYCGRVEFPGYADRYLETLRNFVSSHDYFLFLLLMLLMLACVVAGFFFFFSGRLE